MAKNFPTQDKLFGFDQLMQFIMEYGEQALKAIEQMLKDPKNAEQSELLEQLLKEGMLDKDGKGTRASSRRGPYRKMQRKALMEVFANLRTGQREGHEKVTPGPAASGLKGPSPINMATRSASWTFIRRCAMPWRDRALPTSIEPRSTRRSRSAHPFALMSSDFELHLHEGMTSCSTVVLLDMSGSMMRYGRYLSAKKVAMAMQALVHSQVSAGLDRLRRLLFRREQDSRSRPAAVDAQAGDGFRLPGPAEGADRSAFQSAAALHEPAHGPAACPADSPQADQREQADLHHHRRPAHRSRRRGFRLPALSARPAQHARHA